MNTARPDFWILDEEHHPVRAADVHAWAAFFDEEIDKRRVAYTEFEGDIHISTVFLGIDHRFGGNGPPLLFESMVFGGPLNDTQQRYASWDDAATGHAALVRRVKDALVRVGIERA